MKTSTLRVASTPQSNYIVSLERATRHDLVGGKAYNLQRVIKLGLRVPRGFVVTTEAFEGHLEDHDLRVAIDALNEQLSDQRELSARISNLILNTSLSS